MIARSKFVRNAIMGNLASASVHPIVAPQFLAVVVVHLECINGVTVRLHHLMMILCIVSGSGLRLVPWCLGTAKQDYCHVWPCRLSNGTDMPCLSPALFPLSPSQPPVLKVLHFFSLQIPVQYLMIAKETPICCADGH